jgi:hypothetical protein
MQQTKSRNLSFTQLFDILQQEYVVCEIRVIIYPEVVKSKLGVITRPKDYWKDTAAKKKEKILDISKRNSLPSIFDDRRIKETFNAKILPEVGYPNFLYKDVVQQLIQEKWDLHNYYSEGAQVKVLNNDGSLIFGTINKASFINRKAEIKLKDKDTTEMFDFDIITRIIEL